eukprot:321768_1
MQTMKSKLRANESLSSKPKQRANGIHESYVSAGEPILRPDSRAIASSSPSCPIWVSYPSPQYLPLFLLCGILSESYPFIPDIAGTITSTGTSTGTSAGTGTGAGTGAGASTDAYTAGSGTGSGTGAGPSSVA